MKTFRGNGNVLILIIVVVSWVITSINTHCGMMLATQPNKTYLLTTHPSKPTIYHPPMDKSAFVGAVGSSTIHQGTQKETHSPMCQACNRNRGLSPSCGPCNGPWANSSPTLLQSRSSWKTTSWTIHPWIGHLSGSPGFQHGSPSTLLGQNNMSLDALKRVRGTVWLYLHHSSPKVEELSVKRDLLSSWFLPQRKVRVCE